MTEALQKVTRDVKAMSADKYDVTAQGESLKFSSEKGVSNKYDMFMSQI